MIILDINITLRKALVMGTLNVGGGGEDGLVEGRSLLGKLRW